MGIFSGLGKMLGGIGKAATSVLGNIGSGISSIFSPQAVSSLPNFVDFVNTPATLAAGMKNVTPFGELLGNVAGAVGDNWIEGLDIVASPKAPKPNFDFLSSPGFVNFMNTPAMIAPNGLWYNAAEPMEPQTIYNPQALPPPGNVTFVNTPGSIPQPPPGPVDLVNTPGSILPPGNTITPPGGGGDKPFDWQNFLQTITGAGLLGGQLLGDKGLGPEADKLRQLAGDYGNRGRNLLETSLANQQGLLNAPALNAIERRLEQAKAQIRKSYASMGMSGSSMEAADLSEQDMRASEAAFTSGQQMAITGLQTAANLMGQESSIYTTLMNAQIQKDQELGRVLAEFAAASAR